MNEEQEEAVCEVIIRTFRTLREVIEEAQEAFGGDNWKEAIRILESCKEQEIKYLQRLLEEEEKDEVTPDV